MSAGNVRWLSGNGYEALSNGLSFDMPWPRGTYQPGQMFIIQGNGQEYPLDSREIALWPDGSLKWTAHFVSSHLGYSERYTVAGARRVEEQSGVYIDRSSSNISVSTRLGHHIRFMSAGGSASFEDMSLDGHIEDPEFRDGFVGRTNRLVDQA